MLFFEKKNQKTFMFLGCADGRTLRRPQEQTFFGSFFQKRTKLSCVTAALLLTAALPAKAADMNPLLAPSPLPYDAPPFDKIHDSDFVPAIEAAMKENDAEIEHIANNPLPPSFENTVVALERAGARLSRVGQIFENLAQANTNPAIDAAKQEIDPRMQAHQDSIFLNGRLFARIKALRETKDKLWLDAKSAYLLETTYKQFVHAGAALTPADQARLRTLNQEISKLQTVFQQKLLAATAAGGVVVADKAALAGLDADSVAAAAAAGKQRGNAGQYVLPLTNTTQQPALARLSDRALRARLLAASEGRGDSAGPNDQRDLIAELARLRAEKAALFGFANFAAYALQDQMAKTPDAAFKLLNDLVPGATGKARADARDMQAMIDEEKGGFELSASDWNFYAEQLRRRKFDLDEAAVRPYFELWRVLQDGVFFATHQLYGLSFRERHDIPVYDPDVRVFEVFDADGSAIALFYADYFARANKQGGAWCSDFVQPSLLLEQKPVVANVASFVKPAPGQPALIGFDDVTTMFHEFGHALHTIFSNQYFPSQNGFGVPRDMVEFPSQFNEHWALDPAVFAHYARHYETGAAMPAELSAKIRQAKTFNQGYLLTEYLAAALLDLEWHSLAARAPLQNPDAFEAAALAKHGVALATVPPRYRSTYFAHIWAGGYAASYYAYLWAEVLDDDAYAWFDEHGGLTRENGQRFRDLVLAPGHSADPMALYRAFRGRDPEVGPLLAARGLR
jgi:peptidyl-dipeptidase Dcp